MNAHARIPQDKSEWLRCRKWIEDSLEHAHGTHTIEDIEDGIANGTFRFFCSANSAVVIEIIDYPRISVLNYFLVGGNLEELVRDIEPLVTQWAKEQMGCRRATGVGRKGFERAFKESGYSYCWTAISKDLT